MKHCAAIHHGPSSFGTARHFAPLSCRYTMALVVRCRYLDGTFAAGRTASIKGSSTAHCASVSIQLTLSKGGTMHPQEKSSGANRP